MYALLISDVDWLNATNILLGVVTAVAVLAVGGAIFHDVMTKLRQAARERRHFVFDNHALHAGDLGLTMADGGEPINKEPGQNK